MAVAAGSGSQERLMWPTDQQATGDSLDSTKLKWKEPRWSYLPRLWREFHQIFNLRSLLMISSVSALTGTALIAAFKLAFPLLDIASLWPMLLAVPGLFLYLCMYMAILAVFPPTVVVRYQSLQRTHASVGPQLKPEHVRFACLTVHSQDRIRLKLRYCLGNVERTSVYGISDDIDLSTLLTLLPRKPIVRDARHRGIAASTPGLS